MKIRINFLIAVLVILIAGVTLSTYWMYFFSSKHAVSQAIESNINLSDVLHEAVYIFMRTGQQSHLEAYLRKARELPSVNEITVIRSAALEKEKGVKKNAHPQNDLERQVLGSGQSVVKEVTVRGQRAIRIISPVLADSSCLPCHLTSKAGDVLAVLSTTLAYQSGLDAMKRQLIVNGFVQGLIIVIAMGVIFLFIDRFIISPVIRIGAALHKFGKGDWTATADLKPGRGKKLFFEKEGKVPRESFDEVGELSVAFNDMVLDLREVTVSRDELVKEIVERKKAEQRLVYLMAMFDSTPDFVGFADARDGKIGYINAGGRKMVGLGAQEDVTRLKIADVHPEWTNKLLRDEIIPTAIRDGAWTGECAFLNRDGHEIPVLMVLQAHKSSNGEVERFSTISHDITTQKKAEEVLRKAYDELERRVCERTAELTESRAYIEKILATITDYIYTVTVRDGVAVATTHQPNCLAVTGYTAEEFKDRPDLWENMVHEEDRPKVRAFSAAVLAGKNAEQIEHRIWHKDGGVRWVRNVPVLHYDPSERLTFYDGIIGDITEKKRAEILLIESMGKLAKANKAKDQFLANMSHEVRTPLNTILGFTELLKNTSLDPVQKEYVEMLHDGEEILLSLVTDVLDFSKMAAGEVHLEKVSFDLECLIRSVIKINHSQLQEKGLRIFCIVDEKVPPGFRGDPTRIRQVLMNLLSNAIKFTEKGEIEIRVTLDKEREKKLSEREAMVRIAVRDTGIGIPGDKHKIIFEAFEQADVSTTRKYGGTGLGLSISKGLVTLMGGTIEVESEPGKGSTFSLVLPLEVGPAMKEVQIFPLMDKELEGKKILILDDEKIAREILTHYCEKSKMVVSCSASSAQNALKWLSEQSSLPDIFIVDILMPDLNGYEVAEKVRKNKKYENIKLVAVTKDARGGSASKARQSGFDAYLPKPVSRENFIKVIKTVLGDQREKVLPVEIVTQHTAEELANKGLKILVVEDNPASQELLSIILRSFEFSVEIASDGREAVEKVKQDPYDLILMDLQMPVMGGVEATRIIRKQLHKTVPILALTAGVSENDKEECLAAGMNDYLMKPIEIPQLKDKVFHWVKGAS